MTDEQQHAEAQQDTRPETQNDEEVLSVSSAAFRYVIVAVAFLSLGIVIGTMFAQQGRDIDTATIEFVMRDVLSEMEFSTGEDPNARFELVDDDPYMGEEDAPIVIVEFSDFQCSFCGRHFDETLQPILDNYGEHIRYVFRDFANIGPESVPAALAAECAHDQNKFWEIHEILFSNQQDLNRELYIQAAEDLELDVEAFTTCFDEAIHMEELRFDFTDGQLAGVRGTPGFFVNGEFISGALPYRVFERIIERELRKAGISSDASSEEEA